VGIAGISTRPNEAWMLQAGRNLTDCEGGALRAKQYLIIDRDSKYTAQFRRLIRDNGIQRNECYSPPATVAKSERIRGALRALNQG
jgi:hypothetical protein